MDRESAALCPNYLQVKDSPDCQAGSSQHDQAELS